MLEESIKTSLIIIGEAIWKGLISADEVVAIIGNNRQAKQDHQTSVRHDAHATCFMQSARERLKTSQEHVANIRITQGDGLDV